MKIFRVIDPKNGAILVEGHAKECAARIGCAEATIERAAGQRTPLRYCLRCEEVGEDQTPADCEKSPWENWDEFSARARAYYGVPVRHFGDDLYKAPKCVEGEEIKTEGW